MDCHSVCFSLHFWMKLDLFLNACHTTFKADWSSLWCFMWHQSLLDNTLLTSQSMTSCDYETPSRTVTVSWLRSKTSWMKCFHVPRYNTPWTATNHTYKCINEIYQSTWHRWQIFWATEEMCAQHSTIYNWAMENRFKSWTWDLNFWR